MLRLSARVHTHTHTHVYKLVSYSIDRDGDGILSKTEVRRSQSHDIVVNYCISVGIIFGDGVVFFTF